MQSALASGASLLFDGQYVIRADLGVGRDLQVLHAEPAGGGRDLAIVWFRKALREDEPAYEELERKARSLCRFLHPGVAEVLDFGLHEGRPYIVTEGVRGVPLGQLLARGACLTTQQTIRILSSVLDALTHAHREGIVHGDLSLDHVVLRPDGSAVITGLGIGALNPARVIADLHPSHDLDQLSSIARALLGFPATPTPGDADPGGTRPASPPPTALSGAVKRGQSPLEEELTKALGPGSDDDLSAMLDDDFGSDLAVPGRSRLLPRYVSWLERFVPIGPGAAEKPRAEVLARTMNLALTCAVSVLVLIFALAAVR